jgi:hypothetical protein
LPLLLPPTPVRPFLRVTNAALPQLSPAIRRHGNRHAATHRARHRHVLLLMGVLPHGVPWWPCIRQTSQFPGAASPFCSRILSNGAIFAIAGTRWHCGRQHGSWCQQSHSRHPHHDSASASHPHSNSANAGHPCSNCAGADGGKASEFLTSKG